MDDYWQKVQDMNQDKILTEIESLTKRLYQLSEASPIWNQVAGMLDNAHERHRDLMEFQRAEMDTTPDVLNIGDVDAVVYTPDYSKAELLTNIAKFYYDKDGPIDETPKQEQEQRSTPQDAPQEISQEFTIDVPKFGAKTK
tara:strand:- start:3054 stop:3476 length:423 start_codon:yes stop_codon:yes gene_type:complete